jgi:hypothetical protein
MVPSSSSFIQLPFSSIYPTCDSMVIAVAININTTQPLFLLYLLSFIICNPSYPFFLILSIPSSHLTLLFLFPSSFFQLNLVALFLSFGTAIHHSFLPLQILPTNTSSQLSFVSLPFLNHLYRSHPSKPFPILLNPSHHQYLPLLISYQSSLFVPTHLFSYRSFPPSTS